MRRQQLVFDHPSNSILIENGPENGLNSLYAKAYLQMSYQDYLDK